MSHQLVGDETDREIQAVLVDDNEQWAEFMARDIEQEADDIDVTVALGANEAMLLLEDHDIDCIVSDYQMPNTDGMQLLERVREEHPRLPFVLVTARGSEEVAAAAIDAGVTDYLVKEPRTEQTVLFVKKIHTAVEQYRLQQAIAESEQRYRTVIEQSRDAIGILQEDQFVFCNQGMVELTDRSRQDLQRIDVVETCIHPDDRAEFRETIEGWLGGAEHPLFQDTRVVQPDGAVRHCVVSGGAITYDDSDATLLSFRDVTRRKQRTRELQWERTLNRQLQLALAESRTREEFEQSIVSQFHEQGYALVYIAEQDDDRLSYRVVAGDDSYIDQLDPTVRDGENDSEPCIWAARTGETQFVQSFESLFSTDWRDSALASGYRGGGAIPLVYNDISYGFLAVYHDQPDRFDETERQLLSELADTVAFAIHSLETNSALASDHTVSVTLTLQDTDYYLSALARDGAFVDCEQISVRGTIPSTDDATIQYVTIRRGDVSSVQETLDSHPAVSETRCITAEEPARLQVTVTADTPEMVLADAGVAVNATEVTADGVRIEFDLPAKEDVRSIVERLEATYGSVSVLSVVENEHERSDDRWPADLTDKQKAAVEAAYHHGYFEQPRQSSATDVAESLGVTHSTFLQHLRKAQQKIFEQRF